MSLPHATRPVQVWADIDLGIAEMVVYLNTIEGVRTLASCQGTLGEGGPNPYRAHVMAAWPKELEVRLLAEFDVTIEGECWGYLYPRTRRPLMSSDAAPGGMAEKRPTETEQAIALADRVLDRPYSDPDDDLAVLSRQFLRARLLVDKYKWQVRDTCTRAETAEARIAELEAQADAEIAARQKLFDAVMDDAEQQKREAQHQARIARRNGGAAHRKANELQAQLAARPAVAGLEELRRLSEAATQGTAYTCGPPWFQSGSGVMIRSPDPHIGYMIADTEWDGERDEEQDNGKDWLADGGDDAAFLAAAWNFARSIFAAPQTAPGDAASKPQAGQDALREAATTFRDAYTVLAFCFNRLHGSTRSRDGELCADIGKVRVRIETILKEISQ